MRFVFITMEGSQGSALLDATTLLRKNHGHTVEVRLYNAPSLRREGDWKRLAADIAAADFVFGSMIFGEDHVRPLVTLLEQAMCPVCVITSNPALIRCTRLGKFTLQARDDDRQPGLFRQWMQKMRPKGGHGEGQRQLTFIRSLSKLLKHLPGKARDLHSYIVVHQYWLNSSPENLYRMLCLLTERYIPGYKGKLPIQDPVIYPDTALFHPDAPAPFPDLPGYQKWRRSQKGRSRTPPMVGRVGLIALRSTALSGSTAHIDALTRALEASGIEVLPTYSGGLDFRPAIEQFFREPATPHAKGKRGTASGVNGPTSIDALINTTGFSLVGGPAACRPDEAQAALQALNVGCLDMIPLVFQRVEEWQRDPTGLMPIQLALNVALPELDGAIEPLVIGGPTEQSDKFVDLPEQIAYAAQRITNHVALRRKPNQEKKIAIVLFNFPPNLGNAGTAAYLDVFASLQRLLRELHADGYTVDVPSDVEALRHAVVEGNAMVYGTDGNVADRLPVDDYRHLFPAYADIEPFWGNAPGELLNDGKHFYILGRQFGNVFVGIQPSFGYERDPFRLLMAKDAAPHHGFAAFYTWIEQRFGADAVVHFGTHGALEFMPGKQAGLSSTCWPARLIGTLPNIYYYCVNNPSEGTIAKRRGAATLVSYLVPPLHHAGLYKGLRLLKDNLDSYRAKPSPELLADIRAQAAKLEIGVGSDGSDEKPSPISQPPSPSPQPPSPSPDEEYVATLAHELIQIEQRMIPVGLHVLDAPPSEHELIDILTLVATFAQPDAQGQPLRPLPQQVAAGRGWDYDHLRADLKQERVAQERWEQIDAICREAIRLFVHCPSPNGPSSTVDTYLAETANIAPGTLAPLWAFLDELLSRIVANQELTSLMRALRGEYIAPSPGNDVIRNPAVVPTGRNIHGLDPYHMPTTVAQERGTQLADAMLSRLKQEQGALPETVAMVLWGTDNIKSDGEGVAQALALLGAQVVLDELGNVANVTLIPLTELGRPRIDVVITVSGIFRDLMSHQMTLLDKAAHLAATADEVPEQNFVRKHALEQAQSLNISVAEAATRVFSNAPGSYGANVNHLVESSTWDEEQQLGEAFLSRKSFALDGNGQWRDARPVMEQALSTVDVTFQNIDGFELGISDIDHYYEYLGGVTKSVELARGKRPTVFVADAVATTDRLSSLEQMVRLETRAKLLNPKWFEGMLAHGYEGVHEIEARVSNTYGWSATASAVDGWVYQGVADTFLLDETMRERMAHLNPHATAAVARRLLEAHSRGFWDVDEATLEQLRDIYDDLEDRLEGVGSTVAAER